MSVYELLRANDERFRALAHGFSAEDWSCPTGVSCNKLAIGWI